MAWQWFHRLGSPRWFYEKTDPWMVWLGAISLSMLVFGCVWGLGFTPPDFKQGNSYRVIYIHVPGAAVAMAAYYVMAIAGGIGLIWRMKMSFMVMKAIAPIGAMLTFVALVTGAIWGKPTWGTWWEWDARITSMLILLFLYLGIIALQEAYPQQEAADKTSAILALVGMVNVPIIYKSVDWWYTLHQPATLKLVGKSPIDDSMKYPLLFMIATFYLMFIWLTLLYVRLEVLKRERKTNWVKALLLSK